MKTGWNKGKRYRKYKRLTEEQKEMIYKMFEEKKNLGRLQEYLGRIKNCSISLGKKIKELYNQFIKLLKEAKLVFLYLCMDELYTFIGKKGTKTYVWTAVGITKTGRKCGCIIYI
jgi:hypothetical protein